MSAHRPLISISSGARSNIVLQRDRTTIRRASISRSLRVLTLAAILCPGPGATAGSDERAWPSFLPAPAQVPDADLVREVWGHVTFERTVEAPPLNAAMSVYESIIDAPDILAAAANRLGLTDETADPAPDGGFVLRSPDGSVAWYRVLLHEEQRRVIVSRGTLMVSGLPVRATVLGELKISRSDEVIRQSLTVFVRITNPLLSWITHLVVSILPAVADEELSRGFWLTRGVVTWAASDPGGFCAWLSSKPATPRGKSVQRALNCPAPDKLVP